MLLYNPSTDTRAGAPSLTKIPKTGNFDGIEFKLSHKEDLSHMSQLLKFFGGSLVVLTSLVQLCFPQAEKVVIFAEDKETHRGISGITFATKGPGSTSMPTGASGRTLLVIPLNTRPGDPLEIQLISCPKDYALYSPLDLRVTVPSFEQRASDFIKITFIKRPNLTKAAKNHGLGTAALLNDEVKQVIHASLLPSFGSKATAKVSKTGESPPSTPMIVRKPPDASTSNNFEQAEEAFLAEAWEKAEKLLSDSLEDEHLPVQFRAMAWLMLGTTEMNLTKFNEASAAFRAALLLNPYDSGVWLNYGVSLMLQGRYEDASAAAEQVIKMGDLAAPIHRAQAGLLVALWKLLNADVLGAKAAINNAIALARSSSEIETEDKILLLCVASILVAMPGMDEDALKLLDEAQTLAKTTQSKNELIAASQYCRGLAGC